MPAIDPNRLLGDLATLRTFGAYKTGVHRPTFSPEDVASRHWFAGRMEEAGLNATIDGIGNVVGLSGQPGRKALAGSHLETQNHAGWLDGALGMVYALEAARALRDDPATADLGIDVVAFCDEERAFRLVPRQPFLNGRADGSGYRHGTQSHARHVIAGRAGGSWPLRQAADAD